VLVNLRVAEKRPLESLPTVQATVAKVEKALDGRGRVLIRYSGTEPKVRVMVEGEDEARVREYADQIASELKRALGGERMSRPIRACAQRDARRVLSTPRALARSRVAASRARRDRIGAEMAAPTPCGRRTRPCGLVRRRSLRRAPRGAELELRLAPTPAAGWRSSAT
jgi:hypothetical protein